MALKGTLMLLCSLAVSSFSAAQDETLPQNCTFSPQLLEHLSAELKVAVESGESLSDTWSPQQTAAVLLSLRSLTETLHQHQLHGTAPFCICECRGAEPTKCPEAEVPENGGLACVTVANKRYCKPLCNYGYDFSFLRRSRVYEGCGEDTRYQWETQYIGGKKLAVCDKAPIQVSGAKTAYFPKGQNCLTTKSSIQLQNRIIEEFTTELSNQDILGDPEYSCLVCG